MIQLEVTKTQMRLKHSETLTSGSYNAFYLHFDFDYHWDDLSKTVIFQCGNVSRAVFLDYTDTCAIPWELLVRDNVGKRLIVGVYGMKGEELILPTVWNYSVASIREGTTLGSVEPPLPPPTPDIYDQLLAELSKKMDKDAEISNMEIQKMWNGGIENG